MEIIPIMQYEHPQEMGCLTIFHNGERLSSLKNLVSPEIHILHVNGIYQVVPSIHPYVYFSQDMARKLQNKSYMNDDQIKYWLAAYCKVNRHASFYYMYLEQQKPFWRAT